MQPVDPPERRWQVALPTGTEGPYSAAELRELVKAGRVKPDDHLTDLDNRRSSKVRDVVPDADTLAVGTERIRRRSGASDRQQAAKSGTGSEIRRLRTPLPGMAEAPASAVSPEIAQATAPAAPRSRRPLLLVLTLALALATFAAILLIWPPGLPQDPGLQPYGVWRTGTIGQHQGPWRIELAENGVAIIGADGKRFWSEATIDSIALHEVRAALGTPHPQLGDSVTLSGSDSVMLTTPAGSAAATPVR